MAVELHLGGKNYQYTPRHPYQEIVVADEECAFKVGAPDGTPLFIIKGETADAAAKKLRRSQDMTQEEASALRKYGFFSPNGIEPLIEVRAEEASTPGSNILSRLFYRFRSQ